MDIANKQSTFSPNSSCLNVNAAPTESHQLLIGEPSSGDLFAFTVCAHSASPTNVVTVHKLALKRPHLSYHLAQLLTAGPSCSFLIQRKKRPTWTGQTFVPSSSNPSSICRFVGIQQQRERERERQWEREREREQSWSMWALGYFLEERAPLLLCCSQTEQVSKRWIRIASTVQDSFLLRLKSWLGSE